MPRTDQPARPRFVLQLLLRRRVSTAAVWLPSSGGLRLSKLFNQATASLICIWVEVYFTRSETQLLHELGSSMAQYHMKNQMQPHST